MIEKLGIDLVTITRMRNELALYPEMWLILTGLVALTLRNNGSFCPGLFRKPIRTLFRLRVGRQEMLKTGFDTIIMTQRQFYVWSEEVRKKRDDCRTGELGLDKLRERE